MKILRLPHRHGLKITFIYLVISSCWIVFSDLIIAGLFDDPAILLQAQTYKGLFFILVTAGLLYYLISKNTLSIVKSRDRLEELNREKQAVLSELHHRVKNNLAIIAGLIDLQTQHMEGSDSVALKETQFRIYTLANIEELLYQEGTLASIPFHKCMNKLVSQLEQSLGSESLVQANIDEVNLNINQAVPLGLLVNEIFSQFRVNDHTENLGSIRVDLNYYLPDNVRLNLWFDKVSDDIISELTNSNKIEATLIKLYTKQLQATASWKPANDGKTFNLSFQKSGRTGPSAIREKAG